ncbi:hypothetical protein [Desulfuribacillus alkaliarsenatis]|uniref:N-acetyltransferase domain-containing protein n=1 Tax=Desulfuribacillus alkaliarsenatis TaxID=766136 RepID=A0A1E5G5I8_9FIRM|nr:hypothetical protein [Desulfuribacillus alkaliarsenatis]OEF98365.1 hypothetical protein BHF68_01425 [Desulfuribacillus alkaliarsenatis]
MEIKVVDKKMIGQYLNLYKEVYKDNSYYRDNTSSVLKGILSGAATICKSSRITPIVIVDSGKVVAACTFAVVDRMADTLQLTFFEALPNHQVAIDKMIDYGRKLAQEYGISKILVGLDFHVNYGLGLLANCYDKLQSFGSSYNPPYYIEYFQKHANEETRLVNYIGKMDVFDSDKNVKLRERIHNLYKVRKADFKNLKKDVAIYTSLNNQAFRNHKFYYERRLEEDLELFKDFKWLLKEENLLILEHQGIPIGFMLWYPDFNELINPGESVGVKTVLKNILFSETIQKFKLVEIGVLPAYQKKGAVLALFDECRKLVGNRFRLCESGWVLEENIDSRGFGFRWGDQEYKQFKVFTINV